MLIYASLLYVKSAPAAFYTLIYAPYEHRQVPPQIPHHVACYQHNKGYFLTNYKTGALLRTMARPRARCSQRRAALALRRSPAHEARHVTVYLPTMCTTTYEAHYTTHYTVHYTTYYIHYTCLFATFTLRQGIRHGAAPPGGIPQPASAHGAVGRSSSAPRTQCPGPGDEACGSSNTS